jgi:hypothetical protein
MMKSPREILLKQHRSVEPKLDRIWARTLSPELRSEGTPTRENVFVAAGWTLWRELIWPSRRIWAGLACAWVAILVLNVAFSEPTTRVANKSEPRSREEMQSLIEQRRMLAQMLDPLSEPSRKRRSNPPGPRSDRVARILTA